MAKRKLQEISNVSPDEKLLRDVTKFLNTEYKSYAKYVIETRAIPSLIDGFKVGARKIMHAAFNGGMKSGKQVKNLNLVGDVYNLTMFSHGDASLHGTIFTLSQFFKDNLHPLTIIGQCGKLRDEDAISAPRYLHVKLSEFSKLYKADYDLLEYVFDEGQYLEPVNYLPIIPTVLCARTSGMAPGYKFESFSYNPLDIIDACIDVLSTGRSERKIRPFVNGINQENFSFNTDTQRWINIGEYETDLVNDVLYVNDLPYDIGFDKFEKVLNKLQDAGFIKSWENNSEGEKINYWLNFPKGRLKYEVSEDRIESTLKRLCLVSVCPNNILTVLDEHGKVKVFNTENDLIQHFVKFRLTKYTDRKNRLIDIKTRQYVENSNICKFIELVNSGKIVISNRSKNDIKADLDTYNIAYDVLQIAISKLSNEEKEELLKKNIDLLNEIEYIKSNSIERMYLNDLIELHMQFENKF